MQTLTFAQTQKLATGLPASRNGNLVPQTDQRSLLDAACWSWAISGEYINADDFTSAAHIYQEIFLRDSSQLPTGINQGFAEQYTGIFPDAAPYLQALEANFETAMAKDKAAQTICSQALLKFTASVNGYTILGDGTDFDYTMHVMTRSWYGWDHWGISVKMTDNTRNYIQTVPGIGIKYNCNCMWDEGIQEVAIGIDGLQQTHIKVIELIR